MNAQYEANLKEIKKEIMERVAAEKTAIIEQSNQQYRKLIEHLVESHECERMKLKSGKEAELRSLESKRKKETEDFMAKDKDYLLNHLNEIKQIKSNYES